MILTDLSYPILLILSLIMSFLALAISLYIMCKGKLGSALCLPALLRSADAAPLEILHQLPWQSNGTLRPGPSPVIQDGP